MKKFIVFILSFIVILQSFAFSANAALLHDFSFEDGMPAGWSVLSPEGIDETAKVYVQEKEKMLVLEKTSGTEGVVSAAYDFGGRNGTPIDVSWTFSVFGNGTKNFRIMLNEAQGWVMVLFISGQNLFYTDKDGNNVLLCDNIEEGKKYTLKMSAYTFSNKINLWLDDQQLLTDVPFRQGIACGVGYFITSIVEQDNRLQLYQFSVASKAYNFYLTENFSEAEIGAVPEGWICNKNELEDIVAVSEGEGKPALVVEKPISSSVPAQAAAKFDNISGGFKLQMEFSVTGSGSKVIRFLKNDGSFWLLNLAFSGNSLQYRTSEGTMVTIMDNLVPNEAHTLTIYGGHNGKYDLCIDGIEYITDAKYASGMADQPLGYILFHVEGVGGLKIYSTKIESLSERSFSAGTFSFQQNGSEISTLVPGDIDVYIPVVNDTRMEQETTLLMTCYNENGLLERVSISTETVGSGETKTLMGNIHIEETDGRKIYAYLWDNMEEISSLCEQIGVLN